ncbi:MAG: MFS transporter, partial [Porticoccaceae bacterium]|nr:MFS transporter [Porticoccaceae bacterium]
PMTQTATDQARWADLFSGRNAAIALALSIGVTLHAINIYLSTTILPTVVADIGGLAFYAWNTTLFVVASIIGAAASSKLLQSSGARKAYLISALLLFVGSALAAMAPNMPVMLLGRTLQGAGGGTLLALGYAVVPLVFPERLWQRAFALVSGMWGMATLFGPAIGGIFAELNMWRLAFGVMLPVTALYGLLVVKVLPSSGKVEAVDRLPILQLVLLTLAVLAVAGASTVESLAVNLVAVVISLILLAMM